MKSTLTKYKLYALTLFMFCFLAAASFVDLSSLEESSFSDPITEIAGTHNWVVFEDGEQYDSQADEFEARSIEEMFKEDALKARCLSDFKDQIVALRSAVSIRIKRLFSETSVSIAPKALVVDFTAVAVVDAQADDEPFEVLTDIKYGNSKEFTRAVLKPNSCVMSADKFASQVKDISELVLSSVLSSATMASKKIQ